MNLFQALEWLSTNPGKELDGIITVQSGPQQLKVRNYDGLLQQNFGDGWHACILNLNHAACCSFSIPERKLPELPEPYRWSRNGNGDLEIVDGDGELECYTISTVDAYEVRRLRHALRAALLEEFETRPK